jgi:hypothetical protein
MAETKTLGVRLDEKTNYLLELAMRAKGFDTASDYVKWALSESFMDVELRRPSVQLKSLVRNDKGELMQIQDEEAENEEAEHQQHFRLGLLVGVLWEETPLRRLVNLQHICIAIQASDPYQTGQHLLSPEQARIWDYLWSHDEYLISSRAGKSLNARKIDAHWETIRKLATEGAAK